MYSWHFFCLFQVCLFVIDIFKIYFLKNRSVMRTLIQNIKFHFPIQYSFDHVLLKTGHFTQLAWTLPHKN